MVAPSLVTVISPSGEIRILSRPVGWLIDVWSWWIWERHTDLEDREMSGWCLLLYVQQGYETGRRIVRNFKTGWYNTDPDCLNAVDSSFLGLFPDDNEGPSILHNIKINFKLTLQATNLVRGVDSIICIHDNDDKRCASSWAHKVWRVMVTLGSSISSTLYLSLSYDTSTRNYSTQMEHEIDGWIEQLSQCKQLSEADVKKLCDKVR